MQALSKMTFQKGVYGDKGTDRDSRQPLLLGLPEVEFLRKKGTGRMRRPPGTTPKPRKSAAAADTVPHRTWRRRYFSRLSRNCDAAARRLGIGALFGRMVTSDPALRTSTPPSTLPTPSRCIREESESDYFSVVDDLPGRPDDDPGAAHIGDMELTAGLFYGYVVVDLPGLVSNLEGCDAQAWDSMPTKALPGR